MFFAANIKYLRSVKGVNQSDLGEAMGVTPSTVAGWETGKSSPHFQVLLKLREYFQVDLESLVYRDLQKTTSQENIRDIATDAGITSLVRLLFDQLKEKIEALERRIEKNDSKA